MAVEALNYQSHEKPASRDRLGRFLSPRTFTGKLIWSLGLLSLSIPLFKSHLYTEAILAGGGGVLIATSHAEDENRAGRRS